MIKVLFVCTGNTLRSASAEYLFRQEIQKHNATGIEVASAGTRGNPLGPYKECIERVKTHGADMSGHCFRALTEEIVADADIIICMSKIHQRFLEEHFKRESSLFNHIVTGEATDLQDDAEAHIHPGDPRFERFIFRLVDTIARGMPKIYAYVTNHETL